MHCILLVEDSPADIFLFKQAVQTCSIRTEIIIARDGVEALVLLNDPKRKPDLIVLDLNIPRLNGLQFVEQHGVKLDIPIVVLTGSENPEDRKRALNLGARQFVIKPVLFGPFVEEIHALLNRWFGGQATASVES